MTDEQQVLHHYLQVAHNRGGGWEMAMQMMASRIVVLEDRLLQAEPAHPDRVIEPAEVGG